MKCVIYAILSLLAAGLLLWRDMNHDVTGFISESIAFAGMFWIVVGAVRAEKAKDKRTAQQKQNKEANMYKIGDIVEFSVDYGYGRPIHALGKIIANGYIPKGKRKSSYDWDIAEISRFPDSACADLPRTRGKIHPLSYEHIIRIVDRVESTL